MKQIIFGISYVFNYWFSKNKKPLICGLVLHNNCNLSCAHCRVPDRDSSHIKYEEATKIIDQFYLEGGRTLYLEGGEPFIWKDHTHRMNDIIQYAKEKGFLSVIVYTNGTWTLETNADTVFVSIDGLKETHDALRGESFDKIISNIRYSSHQSIYVNYTINATNYHQIEPFLKYVATFPKIKGTFFYFHTPYYGYDHLYLDRKERIDIMLDLINLKKKYKILNSRAGLKSGIKNNWRKHSEIFKVYENKQFYTCCRVHNDQTLCEDCGYLSYAEVDQALKMKPGALMNALEYF